MLKIKLSRVGSKNRPSYRIVVAPDRSKANGKNIAVAGYYHPLSNRLEIDKQIITLWRQKGAIPTPAVSRLLRKRFT